MKKYFAIISILVFLSFVSTFAGELYEQITVYYNDIKIKVEQKEIDLTNQSFIYKGHIYVPLRYLAESLDYEVKWSSSNKTTTLIKNKVDKLKPTSGETFVYGQILKMNYLDGVITLEQHLDNETRDLYENLKVQNNAIVLLNRNKKEFTVELSDVKVGDMVGLIINENNVISGIIIFT
ncbi:stalk domain-containing protein [Serpentinicella alkaliphila]|uniref:Copper amine oxidase-like protein n=1 Tax=Serpentinicella alkaliphila TaxID=1734049 RepID=A0A4R2U8L0_9FIRM|nr:stalk domain-containing protein [Serpentinicella alkaliphila]QUH25687.1 copper amine oxidase N-terminal domain-containing protein [Serpentinicella alkaliphila]TCQ06599.1 copper amine oxidase-like protein [Serpentinicella alkaliphila]